MHQVDASAQLDPFRPPEAEAALPASPAGVEPGTPRSGARVARWLGAAMLVPLLVVAAALVAIVVTTPHPEAAKPAPPLHLTDQDGKPFSLADDLGRPVLVFFGYLHCPDVCPATIGTLNEALGSIGPGVRIVFVSVDPDRDTPTALKAYLKYLPKAYTALTGTPTEVRAAADAWGVKYAKQAGANGTYTMAHTTNQYLVDAQGRLRQTFAFGTPAQPIADAVNQLLAETPPPTEPPLAAVTDPPASSAPSAPASPVVTPASSATASSAPPAASGEPASAPPTSSAPAGPTAQTGVGATLVPLLVSSEVWAGGPDPVILTITDPRGVGVDAGTPIDVTVTGAGNTAAGPPVRAVPVQPWGEKTVYFVATVTIPSPGGWQLSLSTPSGATGSVAVTALDQGSTTPLGAAAPNIHTPTLSDVGGVVRAVTTQPNPDLRLSETSTFDARAQGKPYVIVIDSTRFRVSSLCGQAIAMVRYLLDRWQDKVVFVGLEPFVYTIVTDEPVLSGDISNPPLNQWSAAWGLGPQPWPATNMPWAFVVDGQGIVRAKYTGIIGSQDLDVIISMIEGSGVGGN